MTEQKIQAAIARLREIASWSESRSIAYLCGAIEREAADIIEKQQERLERLEKRRGGECEGCGSWVCPPLRCYTCLEKIGPPWKDKP